MAKAVVTKKPRKKRTDTHGKIQFPYFYEPLPARKDFSETALAVLAVWGDSLGRGGQRVQCRAIACKQLGLSSSEYQKVEKEIYRLFKLDQWRTSPNPTDAVASAVVIGILATEDPPQNGDGGG